MGNVFGTSSPALPNGVTKEEMDRLRTHLDQCPKDSCLNLDTNRFNLLSKLDKKKAKGNIHVSKDGKFFSQSLDKVVYLSWLIQQPHQSDHDNNNNTSVSSISSGTKSSTKTSTNGNNNSNNNDSDDDIAQLTGQFVQLALDGRPAIPNKVRIQVWRNHTGGNMDGTCYCCLKAIKLDNNGIQEDKVVKSGEPDYRWECGHILSYRNGGADVPINLRPLCFSCNRSMSHKHMILYMIENKTSGLKQSANDLPLLYQFLSDHYNQIVQWQARQEINLKNGGITIEQFRHQQRIMYYVAREHDKTRLTMLNC